MYSRTSFNVAALLGLLLPAVAVPALNAKQLYQFPDATFVEGIAVRSNGELLLTTFGPSQLYALNPRQPSPQPRTVFKLPRNSSTGITEVGPDRFAIVVGDLIVDAFKYIEGTASVFIVDFEDGAEEASLIKDIAVPTFAMLNGLASLPDFPHVILGADSNGRILRIDSNSGDVEVVLEDPLLGFGDSAPMPLGVNGIKVFNGYLYYTNTALGFIGRVPLSADGKTFGVIEQLVFLERDSTSTGYDDFDIDPNGLLYVSLHRNAVVQISQDDKQLPFLGGGNSTFLIDPTSVALSRDFRYIYVTTGGGQVIEAMI